MKGRRKPRIAATYNEQLRRIHKQYIAAGGRLPVRLDDLYDFACTNGLWLPQPSDARKKFCKEMSRALREDYFTDDKGRTVRRNLAALHTETDENGKKVRKSLWDDIDTAPRPHIENAFRVRRGQIVGDCQQLKNDADHRTEVRSDEAPHRLLFDFTDDLAEADLPGDEYNPDAS